jgi:hypothetical protein
MTVIRAYQNKNKPYTDLSNDVLRNPNLSHGAIGLWAKCQSRPVDWQFHISELAKNGKDKKTAIYNQIKELISEGLCIRIQRKELSSDNKMLFKGVEYVFFPSPATDDQKAECLAELKKCFPHSGFLEAEIPHAENQPLQKNDKEKERYTEVYTKNDNVSVHNSPASPPELETPSLKATPYRSSSKHNSIVSLPSASRVPFSPENFDPKTYRMPNGLLLGSRCANAFAKYKGEDKIKLYANLAYFEEMCKHDPDKGESYLQSCIKHNYAEKKMDLYRNWMYASYVIIDSQLTQFDVMKTVVKKKGKGGDSIKLEAPYDLFVERFHHFIGVPEKKEAFA